MPELVFFTGTMDCGKSTLALQTDHNHRQRGRRGLVLTSRDRAGEGVLSSRLGLERPAVEVGDGVDLWQFVVDAMSGGAGVDYLIADEVQFYSTTHVEQLARLVDELGLDVYAFGISTDFRTRLFPGSARLMELADRVEVLQVQALCWCGARGTHNARTVDGVMVVEGDQVVVGDTTAEPGASGVVGYEVLCRRHHLGRMPATTAHAPALSPDPLPFADPAGAG
ncbi:MAG: thymidine kinase [Actinomycetota bacterium]|nr:thymidine kinase [Actinomycetota bacterium]